MSHATLVPSPPFDLHVTALSQTYSQPESGADAYRDGAYYRTMEVEERVWLAVVRASGTVEAPSLLLELKGDALSPSALEISARAISRILSLDLDLRPFYHMARKDPVLLEAIRSSYGLHPPQTSSLLEALVQAIIGQQISAAVARAIRARTVRSLGHPLTVDGQTFYLFPRATDFLNAGHDGLCTLGLSNRKAEYILGIASEAAEGRLEFAEFERLANQEVVEKITQLHGIGMWTAQWVMLRALGRTDVFPAGDLALRRLVSERYFAGRSITEGEAASLAREQWGEFAGLATTYLFTNLRRRLADRDR